jgi:hypothetical protein
MFATIVANVEFFGVFWVSTRFKIKLRGITFLGCGSQMTNTDDIQVEIVGRTADEDWPHYVHGREMGLMAKISVYIR